MIKRLAKSKKSKKGAILVIVVLILALAMIFIASAMMLTQATRRRLYSTTMQSQARLTVTAASEVFLEALKTQEITDVQIDAILGAHATRTAVETDKARMLVDGVPGMGNTADNCTYIDIYKDDNYATNKKIKIDFTTVIGNDRENIQVILQAREITPTYGGRFSNQIELGDNVAKEQLRFQRGVGMVTPSYLTELDNANKSLPADKKLYVDDNTILIRGMAQEEASDSICFSDVVFFGGSPNLGGGNKFYGRFVLLDNTFFTSKDTGVTYNGDFYFIGKSHINAGFKVTSANWTIPNNQSDNKFKTKNLIFSNRDIEDHTIDTTSEDKVKQIVTYSGIKCYLVDANGNPLTSFKATCKSGEDYASQVTNWGSELSEHSDNADEQKKRLEINHYLSVYRGYDYENEDFPSDVEQEVFNKINADGLTYHLDGGVTVEADILYGKNGKVYKKGDTIISGGDDIIQNPLTKKHPSNATTLDLSKLSTLDSTYSPTDGTTKTDRIIGLPAGNYYITGDSPIDDSQYLPGGPYVIAINGANAGSYRFWFSGNTTHSLEFVVFAIYGANNLAPQPCVFVLEDKAVLKSGVTDNLCSGSYLCSSGFISIARPDKNTAKDIGDYIHTKTLGSEDTTWGDAFGKDSKSEKISYSKYYKLHYNVADGVDESPKPAIYIFGVGNNIMSIGNANIIEAYIGLYSNGKIESPSNGTKATQIYGRIEANKIELKTGGFWCMPYCPPPAKTSKLPSIRPAESKYKVVDLVYYY